MLRCTQSSRESLRTRALRTLEGSYSTICSSLLIVRNVAITVSIHVSEQTYLKVVGIYTINSEADFKQIVEIKLLGVIYFSNLWRLGMVGHGRLGMVGHGRLGARPFGREDIWV